MTIGKELFHRSLFNAQTVVCCVRRCAGVFVEESDREAHFLFYAADYHSLNREALRGLIAIPLFTLKRDGHFSAWSPELVAHHAEAANAYVGNSVGPGSMKSSDITDDVGEGYPVMFSLVWEESANEGFEARVTDKAIQVQSGRALAPNIRRRI